VPTRLNDIGGVSVQFSNAPAKQFFRLQIVEAEFRWPDVSPARKESSGGGKHNAFYSVYSLAHVCTGIASHLGGFVCPNWRRNID
jgi:hypothetical protein